ncbi:hypothetical protein BpOF4_04435 [Alkalihalophilus pseudofirmus OF4]|uniref:Uncharacterized protein n=1 Tax=Alkalihalophilus pseudofirmus (strain ATCC BAA-2126 / JCM 17055 / OF4) TaxID=398511 RepID=D3FXW4_ALKPO|nr:hypothetical protein [Alkalihalophilus pseudofirmus]ADC48951.1 hypothetical protein BpOF4_04435 [Alkalihalophilus pseudofirmus OF4]
MKTLTGLSELFTSIHAEMGTGIISKRSIRKLKEYDRFIDGLEGETKEAMRGISDALQAMAVSLRKYDYDECERINDRIIEVSEKWVV